MLKSLYNYFTHKPKPTTINLGKVEYRFYLYNGEVIKKTIKGYYVEGGEFSFYYSAKELAEDLKKEFKKANKLEVGFNYLLDTREIQKIEFDPQERYEIQIEA